MLLRIVWVYADLEKIEWTREHRNRSRISIRDLFYILGGGRKALRVKLSTDATGKIRCGLLEKLRRRSYRIGQKKTVHVYQLIAEGKVEAKVCRIQLLSYIKVTHKLSPGSRNTGQEKEFDQGGATLNDAVYSEREVTNSISA